MGYCTALSEEGEWKDIYDDPVRPRRNGYEWPPDFLQIGAWMVIWALAILHYMVQVPYMNGALFIVVVVITSVLLGGVVVTKVVLEVYGQEDPEVFRTDIPRLEHDELTEEAAPPGTEPCVFCRRYVQTGCKHCSVCDKCIPGFDHHCRWLNSCVGRKNYKLFVMFMAFAWVGMVWIIAMSLYTIIQALRDIDGFKRKMQDQAYHSNPKAFPAIMVFNFLCLVLAIGGAGALGKLIIFHIHLRYTHQSTYEHIMRKRQRKKERGEYKSAAGQTKKEAGCCACLDLKKRRDFKKHGKAAQAKGEGRGSTNEKKGEEEGGSEAYRLSDRADAEPPHGDDVDADNADGVGSQRNARAAHEPTEDYANRNRSNRSVEGGSAAGVATKEELEYSELTNCSVGPRQQQRPEPSAFDSDQDEKWNRRSSSNNSSRRHRADRRTPGYGSRMDEEGTSSEDASSPFSRHEPIQVDLSGL